MRAKAAVLVLAIACVDGARAEDGRRVLVPGLRAYGIAVSADGTRVAAIDEESAVHLIDPEDGTVSAVLPDEKTNWKVTFVGPDASTLATIGEDVCIWNVAKSKVVRRLEAPAPPKKKDDASGSGPYEGFSAAASPGDRIVALVGADRRVLLWNASTEREVGSISSGGGSTAAAFSRDGSKLAAIVWGSGSDETLELYDIGRRALAWKLPIAGAGVRAKDPGAELYEWNGLAFSPDGRTLFAACGDNKSDRSDGTSTLREGAIRAYDVAQKTARWTRRLSVYLHAVAVSPRGDRIAAATAEGVLLLDPATGATAATIGSRDDAPTTVAFSPDGRRLFAAGGAAPGVVRWDLPAAAPGAVPPDTAPTLSAAPVKFREFVRSIAISADGSTLAATEGDRYGAYGTPRIRCYDLAKGTLKREGDAGKGDMTGLAFVGGDADLLAYLSNDDRAYVWSAVSGQRVALLDDHLVRSAGESQTYGAVCVAASRRTREVAVAFRADGSAPRLAIVDPVGTRVLARPSIAVDGAARPIAAAFSPDGLQLAVVLSGIDVALATFRRSDAKAAWVGPAIRRTRVLEGDGALFWHEFEFTSDSRFLVARTNFRSATGTRTVVAIWRTDESGDPWVGATAAGDDGLGLAASPRGDGVAMSARDGAGLVDPATGATIRRFPGTRSRPAGLAFSPDGRRLYAAVDQDLVFWDLGEK